LIPIGQNRTAVVAGDDPLKPTRAVFAVLDPDGAPILTKEFPAGYLPLLNAVPPARPGQPGQPVQTAAPREPAFFDPVRRLFLALARAADASKDAFIAFPLDDADPRIVTFPDGWFAASCTNDIRLFNLELVGRLALAGSRVAETEFKAACAGSGFLMLDLADGAVSAEPLPGAEQLRATLNQMNNYVFGSRLDTTRTGTSDTLYVLDGVNGSAFLLPLPATVNGFTDATLQQIPDLNSLLVQTVSRAAGDQGLLLFNLDEQTVMHLPVPEGFTTVNNLGDAGTVCCLATRKLVGRAMRQGGSAIVIYDLLTNDIMVAPNPEGITSTGPPPGLAGVAAARLILANSRANTVAAVAYSGGRQAGIMVIRIP
jgi:hypothetical protein